MAVSLGPDGLVLDTLTIPDDSGGAVIQVVSNTDTTSRTSTGTTTDSASVSITPKSSGNKVLFICNMSIESYGNGSDRGVFLRLRRGSAVLKSSTYNLYMSSDTSQRIGEVTYCFLDSPNTTSATAYKFDFRPTGSSATARVNNYSFSTLTVIEVAV